MQFYFAEYIYPTAVCNEDGLRFGRQEINVYILFRKISSTGLIWLLCLSWLSICLFMSVLSLSVCL